MFNLPFRDYVWEGGKGVDLNGDGIVADLPPDPTATPPFAGLIETTVPWCFAYGEEDWLVGRSYSTVKKNALGSVLSPPVGRFTCP